MRWGKRVLRYSAVLGVALAAAHAAESLKSSSVSGSLSLDTLRMSQEPAVQPKVDKGAVPQSASLSAPGKPGLDDVIGITSIAADAPEGGTDPCQPNLGLTPAPDGMVALRLQAPCNPGERVVIRHAGLSFTALSSPSGVVALSFPALRTDALVAVYLEDSQFLMGQTTVPDADDFTRVALIWEPPAELEMRVTDGEKVLVGGSGLFESGAEQVFALGSAEVAAPVLSRVYSVPGHDLGEARISAELRITPASCGRTIRLATLLSNRGTVLEKEQLVPVPLCGTSGDILVLKNLAPALKLVTPK